ncbi:MAG: hypothetical protein Q4G16_08855 [Cruoricaptor ignavus]|nr:hypothetical protein [Cruoricaptor ignavus]
MTNAELNELRNELSVKAKNGIDFTLAASLIWFAIAFIWNLESSAYNKSIFVFMIGAPLLPLAFLLSKVFKTNWKVEKNPLQPLGIWFNIAQLFYFPFLIFTMIKIPEYFIMTYSIITGAHFFLYSWFYNTKWYAIFGGLISLTSLILALNFTNEQMYLVAVFTGLFLLFLTSILYYDVKKKKEYVK